MAVMKFEWYTPTEMTQMLDIKEIAEECAQRLTDAVDTDTLVEFFYDKQLDYFNTLSLEDLMEQARDLGVDIGEWDTTDVA